MANILSNYFSEIGQKQTANIELPHSANILSRTSFITQWCTSFYLQPITESNILKHITEPIKEYRPWNTHKIYSYECTDHCTGFYWTL